MKKEYRSISFHGVGYLFTQIFSRIAGILSFPIITRLLTPSEYGVLALANTTLLLLVAFGKSGLAPAVIMRWPDYDNRRLFYKSSILSALICGLLVLSVYLILLFPINKLLGNFSDVFLIIVMLALFRIMFSVHLAWFRATGRVRQHNILTVFQEIASTILVICSLIFVAPTVLVIFIAKAFIEGLVCIISLFKELYNYGLNQFSLVSRKIIEELICYGAPLLWLEVSNILMTFADRYQIGYFIDTKSVGLYSVAYNISQYGQQILAKPIALSALPIYSKIYKKFGAGRTSEFLNQIIFFYCIIAIPLFFFLSFNSKIIIRILASEKYSSAAFVMPLILAGSLLQGMLPILAAGLYLNKKTKQLGKITIFCAIFNIIVNSAFIPMFGYSGAAFSTLLTFVLLIWMVKRTADHHLKLSINFMKLLKILGAGFLSYLVLYSIAINNIWSLLLGCAIYIGFYFALLLIFEKDIRGLALSLIARLKFG